MEHFLALIGNEREKPDGNNRRQQVFAVEVIGVEDGDNADGDQVVDHCEGEQEDAHRRGQVGAHTREYGHRERNVGGGGDGPAVHRCFAGVVNNEVEDGGGDDAAARRSNGDDRGARGFEVANDEFFFELKAGEEEEDNQ